MIPAIVFYQPTPEFVLAIDQKFKIAIVIVDDLALKPVPLTNFRIRKPSGEEVAQFKTDEFGEAFLSLPTGKYKLESIKDLIFKDRVYSWKADFEVIEGKDLYKFSDSDATVLVNTASSELNIEKRIYNEFKDSVVSVEGDSGHGSGFIIDSSGLILTNHHVVNGSNWIAIRLDRGKRYRAQIVIEDESADVAVLMVNPSVLGERKPLKLLDFDKSPPQVGDRVAAIGSPLNQERIITSGIISKIERGAIISDVNINHGNSGGPLFIASGEVIGISTFGDFTNQGGPGISGIIPILTATPIIESAKLKFKSIEVPSSTVLPDISEVPIPIEHLHSARNMEIKPYPKFDGIPSMDIIFNTPIVLASEQYAFDREMARRSEQKIKGRKDKGGDAKALATSPMAKWNQYVGNSQAPIVQIQIIPEIGETNRSKNNRLLGAILTGASGSAVTSKGQYHFKDEFYDMQLIRGGSIIEPVRRYRIPVKEFFDDNFNEIKDSSHAGVYLFDPRAFKPGEEIIVRVRLSSNLSKWHEKKLDKKIQDRIWSEFLPWRVAAKIE